MLKECLTPGTIILQMSTIIIFFTFMSLGPNCPKEAGEVRNLLGPLLRAACWCTSHSVPDSPEGSREGAVTVNAQMQRLRLRDEGVSSPLGALAQALRTCMSSL